MALTPVQSGGKLHNHTVQPLEGKKQGLTHGGSNCRPGNPQECALSEILKCQRIQECR